MELVSDNVIKEVTSSGPTVSLRERIRKSMGNGIQVSWSTMPEVKSSGLLGKLSDKQLTLEQLKFCLISCEVAYNTELVELVNLSKRSISWADPLPAFNRRTIASTIERLKRCSDGFLSNFEKHWNIKPVVNMATLNKVLSDMAVQYQNYITYCTHQEDLRTVLRTAMRSKYEVVAAAHCNRMNVERVLLPLQHLKLYRSLLQDIRSLLMTTTNRLENFHCKRALTDVTKILEECYKVLGTLHGPLFVAKLDRQLEETVHGIEPEPLSHHLDTSKQQTIMLSDPFIIERPIDCVDGSKSTSLVEYRVKNETSEILTVKERCKFFNLHDIVVNSGDGVKCSGSRKSTLQKQVPIEVRGRHHSSPTVIDGYNPLEVGELNNNSYRGSNNSARSKYSFLDFQNIFQNSALKSRHKCMSVYEAVYGSLEQSGSSKHINWLKNKLKLSSNENLSKHPQTTNTSTNTISLHSSNLSQNILSRKKPCFVENSDKTDEDSTNDRLEIENYKNSNHSKTSTEHNNNNIKNYKCQKLSLSNMHCNSGVNITDRPRLVNKQRTPTSPHSPPPKLLCRTFELHSIDTDEDSKRHRSPSSMSNKEEKISSNDRLDELNTSSSSNDRLDELEASTTEDTSSTKEIIGTNDNHQNEVQKSFISSYDLGCPNIVRELNSPFQEENLETDSFYGDYKPMNESFRGKFHQFKSIRSLQRNRNVRRNGQEIKPIYYNGRDSDSDNTYEEYQHSDSSGIEADADISSNSLFSTYEDVPLYQAYKFGSVKHPHGKAEENVYMEPDEHIYEEIQIPQDSDSNSEDNEDEDSNSDMKISRPSGTSQRVQWVDIDEVARTGLLVKLNGSEIALQEAKYEIITSEASYYKSLVILDTLFIMSPALSDKNILSELEHITLFSNVKKVKQCSEKFIVELVNGWQEDLMLGYLCHAVSKFVASGAFQVYVEYCANQTIIDRTLQQLKLNPEFTSALKDLEADPVCQMFTLQSFLTLPMQRATRLPLLVQAILRRLSSDHPEYNAWNEAYIELEKIVNECNEAAGRAEKYAVLHDNYHENSNKALTMNQRQLSHEKKKQTIWKIFKRKQRAT